MQAGDAGCQAPPFEHLSDPARLHRPAALLRQPQGLCRPGAALAYPEVAVERLGGLRAERVCPHPTALAQHGGGSGVEVEVIEAQAGKLGQPHAGVREQPNDRRIAPRHEVTSFADLEQPADLIGGQHLDRRSARPSACPWADRNPGPDDQRPDPDIDFGDPSRSGAGPSRLAADRSRRRHSRPTDGDARWSASRARTCSQRSRPARRATPTDAPLAADEDVHLRRPPRNDQALRDQPSRPAPGDPGRGGDANYWLVP